MVYTILSMYQSVHLLKKDQHKNSNHLLLILLPSVVFTLVLFLYFFTIKSNNYTSNISINSELKSNEQSQVLGNQQLDK